MGNSLRTRAAMKFVSSVRRENSEKYTRQTNRTFSCRSLSAAISSLDMPQSHSTTFSSSGNSPSASSMTAAPESPMRMPLKSSSRASVETVLPKSSSSYTVTAPLAERTALICSAVRPQPVRSMRSRAGKRKKLSQSVSTSCAVSVCPAKESSFAAEEAVTPSTSTSQRKERLGNAAVSASCIS